MTFAMRIGLCTIVRKEANNVEYIRVNITLESEDIERLQQLERVTGKSRSELIRDAVRAYRPPQEYKIDRAEILRLLETVRVDFPTDPVTMIRSMREGKREW